MNIEELIQSSILWGKVCTPNRTSKEQLSIVLSEVEEFVTASIPTAKALECADVVWVLGYEQYLHQQAGNNFDARLAGSEIESYRKHYNALAFQACSISNWSKLLQDQKQAEAEALILMDNPRFKNVDVKYSMHKGIGYYFLVGEDHQNPRNIQYNKILKPSTYRSKEEVYGELVKTIKP